MREFDDAEAGTSLDRRSLIKKAGVAGAVAWSAPIVVGSVLSPAAAASEGASGGINGPFSIADNFDGVPNGDPGPGFIVYEPPGTLPDSIFRVTGSNVDAVAVGQHGSGPFVTGNSASQTTVIELAGTGGAQNGGIATTVSLNEDIYTISFDYVARTDRNFTVTLSGSAVLDGPATEVVDPPSTGSFQTYSRTFEVLVDGTVTITIADTASAAASGNQGVLIGAFLLTN